MKRFYSICGKRISVEAPELPADCADWQLFEAESGRADIEITCTVHEKLPEIAGKYMGKNGEFSVYTQGEYAFRTRAMGTKEGFVAKYSYAKGSKCEVYLTPHSLPVFLDDRYLWSTVSLAQLLLPERAVLLHASYIDIGGEAILFSAPCSTGKSTQAELWRLHKNAEIINGDKVCLYLKGGRAYAGGVPFCGTSKICKNRDLPVKAIVLLSQGKENVVKKLTGFDALQRLISNIYLDLLAPLEKQMCIDFGIELLSSAQVLSLECTPDEKAVKALSDFIQQERK